MQQPQADADEKWQEDGHILAQGDLQFKAVGSQYILNALKFLWGFLRDSLEIPKGILEEFLWGLLRDSLRDSFAVRRRRRL